MRTEGRVLIARYSFRKNSPPKMVALVPQHIDGSMGGNNCGVSFLEMQYLPFAEDIREWTCASLPVALPEQHDAVSALVDAMTLEMPGSSLSSCALISGGVAGHSPFQPEDNYSPSLARFYNFLSERAVNPVARVPAPGRELRALIPLAKTTERVQDARLADRLTAAFGLQKVEKKGKLKRFWREAIAEKRKIQSLGEVDTKRIKVETVKKLEKEEDEEKVKAEGSQGIGHVGSSGMALPVGPPPRVHVGSVYPERDFERWLAHKAGGHDVVGIAIEQMCGMINRLAKEGEEFHPKALSCVSTLRRGCVSEGEPAAYNAFVRNLRLGITKYQAQLWEQVRNAALGLITDRELATSTVTAEEARAFLAGETFVAAAGLTSGSSAAPVALCEADLEAMIE